MISFVCQDSKFLVDILCVAALGKFASGLPHQDDSAEGAHGSKVGLGAYHSLLGEGEGGLQ